MTQTAPAAFKPQIAFEDFAKVDLRVATVIAAEPHPNADRLLKLQLDDGSGVPRQVCAGIRAWYDPAALVGRQVVVVANLAPRILRGEASQGMVLAATGGAPGGGEDVVLLALDRPARPGSVVS
jgi:methionyl-tRNA synthetase